MTGDDTPALMWNLAVLSGWLAIGALVLAWYARRRFHALLKAPLTEEVEHQTHIWEHHIPRWTSIGLWLAGLSLLSCAAWLVF
ncbi:hypothetical protein [Microvirga roseola]|uniref:hypothetical protein n=1 Tax=Microvirga roseola TaxID=2883126 RepID=UPI001E595DEF|nr:hypothetical protein [Microvirga roseola]